MSGPAQGRYYSLDGMRGLAAIVVVLHHFGLQRNPSLAGAGYLAVDFFFALSGFVIALAYQDRLTQGLSTRRFMAQRVIRLYPLFLAGIALGLVKAIGQIVTHDGTALPIPELLLSFVTSLLMLPTPGAHLVSTFPLNTPGWSLFFEMIASLAFGAVLFRWRTASLALAAGIAALLLMPGILSHDGRIAGLGTSWPDFIHGFPRVFFSFLTGVLIFRLSRRLRRQINGDVHIAIVVLIALLLGKPDGWMDGGYDMIVLGLAIPAILWAGVAWEVPERHQRFFGWLGDISYPLYILHFPLLMIYLFLTRHLPVPSPISCLIFVLGMLLVSTLAFHLYDAPVRAILSMRFRMPGSCRFRRPAAQMGEPPRAGSASARTNHNRNAP
ncbi:MAG TPA: acyltransferase [Sphingobium sp.]